MDGRGPAPGRAGTQRDDDEPGGRAQTTHQPRAEPRERSRKGRRDEGGGGSGQPRSRERDAEEDGGPRPGGRRQPTRAAAIAAGDRVCARFRREVAAIDEGSGDDFQRLARRTAALRALTADAVERLGAVDAPRELRRNLRAYVDAIAAQLPVMDDLRAAAQRRDRRGVGDAVAQIETLGAAAKRFARRVGFRVCGSE